MSGSPWVRTALAAAVTLVIGLVLGGLGPRAEVRRLEAKVFALERAAARRPPAFTQEITDILTRPAANAPVRTPLGTVTDPDDAPARRRDWNKPPRPVQGVDTDRSRTADRAEGSAEDEALAVVKDTLAVRAAQARAALFQDIDPTPAQMDEIEAAVEDMNDQLYDVTRSFLERAHRDDIYPRRDTMALGADVLDVLVSTEQRILDGLTPGQRANVREEATDPTSFVDPSLLDLAGEFENLPQVRER